jgi:hypothetical protein
MDNNQPPTANTTPPPTIPAAGTTRAIDDARLTLTRILAGAPPPAQVLAAAAALGVLDDTGQPPAPVGDDVEPLTWSDGQELALARLRSAIDEATTMAELARIASAALELRGGSPPDRPMPDGDTR